MTGCGISHVVPHKVPKQIKSLWCFTSTSQSEGFFLRWVVFRVNRLLRAFSQINNSYDRPSFIRIWAEFGISTSADLQYKGGDNHGLRSVIIYVTAVGPEVDHSLYYTGRKKFGDEGGKAIKENLIYFIRNDKRKLRGNSTSSWQTSQKVWRKLRWRDWISRLRNSFIAFLVHKSM